MISRSYYGAVVLLLATACFAFAATPPQQSAAPPPQQQAAITPVSTFSVDSNDGFQKTVTYFQTCKKWGADIEVALQRLYAASGQDKATNGTIFLKKLNELYPGSTFNGKEGTVSIRKDLAAHFTDSLKVDRLIEIGGITVTYHLLQGLVHLTDGVNAATIMIDQTTPGKSTFIDVNIAAIKNEAEKIVTDPDRRRIAAEPAESAVLTDAYQLLSMVLKTRMDVFAGNMMRDPALQRKALKIADNGYRERHPQDYQAADPTKKKNKVDAKPDKPADQRFYQGFVKLFAFILSAVGVLWAIFTIIRVMKTLSTDNARKRRKNKYQTLSPMVTRLLKKTGSNLWGRNLPWSKNYYIYERTNRWLLCDGKEEKDNKISQARTKIEVRLRSTYFKIKLTRANGVKSNLQLTSNDYTKIELDHALQELIQEMANPTGKYDHVADETVESAGLSPASASRRHRTRSVVPVPLQEPVAVAIPIPQPATDTSPEVELLPPEPRREQLAGELTPVSAPPSELPDTPVPRPKRKRPPRKKAQPAEEFPPQPDGDVAALTAASPQPESSLGAAETVPDQRGASPNRPKRKRPNKSQG